jgi:hypothetical protein
MFEDDVTYFRRRAEAELAQAQRATVREVVRAHFLLAEAYLARVAAAEAAGPTEHA